MQSDTGKPSVISHTLRSMIRRGVSSLPPNLRLSTDLALGGLSDIFTNWQRQAYLIQGRLHTGADNGSLIYFGQGPQYRAWVASLFSEHGDEEPLGTFSLLDIAQEKGPLADCDALLCPSTPLSQKILKGRWWFVAPKHVSCIIDLRRPLEQLVNRHAAKDDLRIARKKNYRFAILRDDQSFDEFYHEMLVPTSRIRHEERANISQQDVLRSKFHQGYLLAAYQGNEWVGANLMLPQTERVLNWANIGWRDGREQLMKDRLVSALMYEMITRGKNEEFDTLDLGSCNPFVNDGPLNYKLKWGAYIILPQLGYEGNQLEGLNAYFSIRFNLASEGARSMLKHSPILDKYENRLRAIGWNSPIRPDFRHQIEEGLPWVDLAG